MYFTSVSNEDSEDDCHKCATLHVKIRGYVSHLTSCFLRFGLGTKHLIKTHEDRIGKLELLLCTLDVNKSHFHPISLTI